MNGNFEWIEYNGSYECYYWYRETRKERRQRIMNPGLGDAMSTYKIVIIDPRSEKSRFRDFLLEELDTFTHHPWWKRKTNKYGFDLGRRYFIHQLKQKVNAIIENYGNPDW